MNQRAKMRGVGGVSMGVAGVGLVGFALGACTEIHEGDTIHYHLGGESSGGAPDPGGTGGAPGSGGSGDYVSHLPPCETVSLEELDFDPFERDGNLFYFEVTPAARRAGDERRCSDGGSGEGVYDLDGSVGCPLPAFNVRVAPAGSAICADTGRVELKLVGQSSFMPWSNIPNFNLDIGEFQDLEFASGDKRLRFNNGQADSTVLREPVALRIWRALGYPAPPTRFVRTRSNVWDTEVHVGAFAAHVMVQPYKKRFFKDELESAVHVWEGAGDPFGDGWYDVECEWSAEDECDDDALADVVDVVDAAPTGDGFQAATASVIDWPALFENQCLSALTGTGDDWIHNGNNVVLVLREDGKVQYLPYSTDISGGHPWYPHTPWSGGARLIDGCMNDEACRTASLERCEQLIDEFEALDVVTSVVGERCGALKAAGLMRGPDESVCESLASFYWSRADELRQELASIRDGGWGGQGGAGGGGEEDLDGAADGGFPETWR